MIFPQSRTDDFHLTLHARLNPMTLRRKLLALLFAVAFSSAPLLTAQAPAPHPTSTPYAGDLSIFEEPGRDKRLQIDRVMDLLNLKPGSTVADIGAGGGWFIVRAARRVAPNGRVIAEEINPKAIAYIQQRTQREHLSNIVTLLGTPDDPKLAPDSLDAALMLKVYHEIAQPVVFMERLKPSLRSGALVGVIDRNGNGENHGVAREVVIREADEAGYQLLNQYDFVNDGMDYFLVFGAK